MNSLTQKVALVTGASRGIGAAIAQRLAADGAAVAITHASSSARAKEVVKAIEDAGGKAIAIQADSGNVEDVKRAVEETVKTFGGLDILVNNAGILKMAPIGDFPLEDFDRIMDVNVKGVFLMVREASHHLKEGGRIINIGSVNSDAMPFAGGSVYAMTKGAVASFTRGLARDLGPRGITVNNVQPGPVDTEMNPAEGEFAETLKGMMALPRYGTVAEIASLVAYLASPDAAYVTGANLKIDGGFDA